MRGKINHKIIEALRLDDLEQITGYNMSGNVKEIENLQAVNLDAQIQGDFEMVCRGKNCEMYKCAYQIEQGELELRHIFF